MKPLTLRELPVNPVALVDNAVLALASLKRGKGSSASLEFLKQGIEACDYLIYIWEEVEDRFLKEPLFSNFPEVIDKKALIESGLNLLNLLDRIGEIKGWIEDLINNPNSHTPEEIEYIQEFLITITMPIWQKRTVEFRRKMRL